MVCWKTGLGEAVAGVLGEKGILCRQKQAWLAHPVGEDAPGSSRPNLEPLAAREYRRWPVPEDARPRNVD
jgi:hypothetical protein